MPSEWLENSFRSVSLGFCVDPTLQCSVDPLLNGAAEIQQTSLLKPLGNAVAGKNVHFCASVYEIVRVTPVPSDS